MNKLVTKSAGHSFFTGDEFQTDETIPSCRPSGMNFILMQLKLLYHTLLLFKGPRQQIVVYKHNIIISLFGKVKYS